MMNVKNDCSELVFEIRLSWGRDDVVGGCELLIILASMLVYQFPIGRLLHASDLLEWYGILRRLEQSIEMDLGKHPFIMVTILESVSCNRWWTKALFRVWPLKIINSFIGSDTGGPRLFLWSPLFTNLTKGTSVSLSFIYLVINLKKKITQEVNKPYK